MLKYLLTLLLLLPFPVVATTTPTSSLDSLTHQFHWLLEIYLSSPCQDKIPVTTKRGTFLVDKTQLLNSLQMLDNEIKNLEPSDPFDLSSVRETSSQECK